MKNYKFKTHCDHYYYGNYHDLNITVFGEGNYFIPSVREQRLFSNKEHLILIVKK